MLILFALCHILLVTLRPMLRERNAGAARLDKPRLPELPKALNDLGRLGVRRKYDKTTITNF